MTHHIDPFLSAMCAPTPDGHEPPPTPDANGTDGFFDLGAIRFRDEEHLDRVVRRTVATVGQATVTARVAEAVAVDREVERTPSPQEADRHRHVMGSLPGKTVPVTSVMQGIFLALVHDAAARDGTDLHVLVGADATDVRVRADGSMSDVVRWTRAMGLDLCAAASDMADCGDDSHRPLECQDAWISGTTAALPGGVDSLRLRFEPLPGGGRLMICRMLRAVPASLAVVPETHAAERPRSRVSGQVSAVYGRDAIMSVAESDDEPPEYVIHCATSLAVVNADEPGDAHGELVTSFLDLLMADRETP